MHRGLIHGSLSHKSLPPCKQCHVQFGHFCRVHGCVQQTDDTDRHTNHAMCNICVTNSPFQSSSYNLLKWFQLLHPLNTVLTSLSSPHASFLSTFLSAQIQLYMFIIPLILFGCQTLICFPSHLSALHLVLAVTVS